MPPEAAETLQFVNIRKVFCVSHVVSSEHIGLDYCFSTQICIQNVGLLSTNIFVIRSQVL